MAHEEIDCPPFCKMQNCVRPHLEADVGSTWQLEQLVRGYALQDAARIPHVLGVAGRVFPLLHG